MSSEATIQNSIQISIGSNQYVRPGAFRADVSVFQGPTPGLIVVPTSGINVNLSLLTTPGFCRIANLLDPADSSVYITYGMYDPVTQVYYPLGEVLPGEAYVIRLSRLLGDKEGTGSGTGSSGTGALLRLDAIGGTCPATVEAFNA